MSEHHGLVQFNTVKLEVPQPVNRRTKKLKTDSGTGVVIECFGSRFLVTARHLFYDTTKAGLCTKSSSENRVVGRATYRCEVVSVGQVVRL